MKRSMVESSDSNQVYRDQQCRVILLTSDKIPCSWLSQDALASAGSREGSCQYLAAWACAGGHGTLGCPVVWVTKRAIKFTSGCCLRNPRQYCMVIESTKRVGFTSHDLLLSYATFWKTYRAKWSNVLRFQTATTHGVCDTCQEYKEQFRCASGACWLMFGAILGKYLSAEFSREPQNIDPEFRTPWPDSGGHASPTSKLSHQYSCMQNPIASLVWFISLFSTCLCFCNFSSRCACHSRN